MILREKIIEGMIHYMKIVVNGIFTIVSKKKVAFAEITVYKKEAVKVL
jgi:hypothetical protein